MCVSSPVYPVIIGNVRGARRMLPDPDWKAEDQPGVRASGGNKDKANDDNQGGDIPAWMFKSSNQKTDKSAPKERDSKKKPAQPKENDDHARRNVKFKEGATEEKCVAGPVVTRAQARKSNKVHPLKVKEAMSSVDKSTIEDLQKKDSTLKKCFDRIGKPIIRENYVGEFYKKNGLHSAFSGHLGAKKTEVRILPNFFWPGLRQDFIRFCRSCDVCQRTVKRGSVKKVPLGSMPLIDTPFKRVAVDTIRPIAPPSEAGHRYILTLVDYATRYPEEASRMEFLGHEVGGDVITPSRDNLKKVRNTPRPTTKKQVRSFLGLVGYYRDHIPAFTEISVPLTDLLKKGKSEHIQWCEAHERAYSLLKEYHCRSQS